MGSSGAVRGGGAGRYRVYYSRYPGRAIDEAPGEIHSGVITKG